MRTIQILTPIFLFFLYCSAHAIDAQEFANRMEDSLDFDDAESYYRLLDHNPILFTVEVNRGIAKVYFDGNLMFEMTAVVKDLDDPRISIADNLIELSSENHPAILVINKAGKSIRLRSKDDTEVHFGTISIESRYRDKILQITLKEHKEIRFSISQKLNASISFLGQTIFSIKGRDVSLKGKPKKSLVEFIGKGGHRKMRFNRSRETLYFPDAPASRQVFAKLQSLAPEMAETSAHRKAFNKAKKEFLVTDYFCDGRISFVDKSEGEPHWIWRHKVNYRNTETKLNKDQAQYITKCIQQNERLEKLLKKIRAAAGKGIDYELEKMINKQ
jgi:hypothetical protein